MRGIWEQTPRDSGHLVRRHWASSGEGAVCRIDDGTSTRYTLHRWILTGHGVYEPQNGLVGCWRRGRRIDVAEVCRLLGPEAVPWLVRLLAPRASHRRIGGRVSGRLGVRGCEDAK
jgi:hypothetical protein